LRGRREKKSRDLRLKGRKSSKRRGKEIGELLKKHSSKLKS